MTDATTFATDLLSRGIEFVLRRNGRLHVWPKHAYNHLTEAEKEFIREHRAELRSLAASKVLPETTVVWQPPTNTVADPAPAPPVPQPCIYCGRSPCIGTDHWAFAVLHANDPREVKRRDEAATAVMLRMLGLGGRV